MSTKEFYESGRGDRLIDPRFFPKSIKRFLQGENKLLERKAPSVDLLVEIGCMHGRYLEWTIRHQKRYLGIDIVQRYLEIGRNTVAQLALPGEIYQFILGGAEAVSKLVHPNEYGVPAQRCLLWFPFNSFGNIENPLLVLQELKRAGLPFLISSYQTTAKATASRERYYRACGYRTIRVVKDNRGVCFLSSDGLRSMAYDPRYIQRLGTACGLQITGKPFAQIGMVYESSVQSSV